MDAGSGFRLGAGGAGSDRRASFGRADQVGGDVVMSGSLEMAETQSEIVRPVSHVWAGTS